MRPAPRHIPVVFALLLVAFPLGGAVAQDGPNPDPIRETVAQIDTMIAEIDIVIDNQETRLTKIYAQRDATEAGAARASLDQLIDTVTLQLDKSEALRVTLETQADSLREAVSTVEVDLPATSGASE